MQGSVQQFLEQVARRGSWLGGGSAAALAAALSAALLEKLVVRQDAARRLRAVRRECGALIDRDAVTFSRAIAATRTGQRAGFAQALKTATEVPYRVFANAHTVGAIGRAEQRAIKRQFQSDVRCAIALADAAATSARTLVDTNLAWLKDRPYAASMRKRLRLAMRPHAR